MYNFQHQQQQEHQHFEICKGRFRVYVDEEPIGSGGQGTVYRGVEFRENQSLLQVAVKCCYGRATTTTLKEYDLMKDIDHPNIVKYYGWDVSRTMSPSYLVMEMLETSLDKLFKTPSSASSYSSSLSSSHSSVGQSLLSSSVGYPSNIPQLPCGVKLSSTVIKKITFGILNGISYLHEKGIYHRDMKPSNVLISKSDVKISDFGLSRRKCQSSPSNGGGPMMYLSPNRAGNFPGLYTSSDDLWSVAITLIEFGRLNLITMQQYQYIFKERNISDIKLFPEFGRDYFKELKEIIEKCLSGNYTASQLLVEYDSYFKSVPPQSSNNLWLNFLEREGDHINISKSNEPSSYDSSSFGYLPTFDLNLPKDDDLNRVYTVLELKAFKDQPHPGKPIIPTKQNSIEKVLNSINYSIDNTRNKIRSLSYSTS